MGWSRQIFTTSISQALGELKANRLRTALSLSGIAIGIFCIVAVLTVLNSMEQQIQTNVSSLGTNVLYIGRKPWMPEEGVYKWWEYLQRRPLSLQELRLIERNVPGVDVATMSYVQAGLKLKSGNTELEGALLYAVTPGFDKIQNVEVKDGRYLNNPELESGSNNVVIGSEVKETLFGNRDALGQTIQLGGRAFHIVGVFNKEGQNQAGFNFDNALVMSYATAASLYDTHSMNWSNDPVIMVRAKAQTSIEDLKDEVRGLLRSERRVRPGAKDDFSINQLAQVAATLESMFATINIIGSIIGGFSLLVGAFGIANIMFVTVRERTKVIGLKKAIGARKNIILTEFLIEAVTLCLIGGIIGILLVFFMGLGLTYVADFPVSLGLRYIVIGLVVSAVVGIVSGAVPALKAARLDPVVAIRST